MKIFCIGRNYVEHAKELNNAVPTKPLVFMKPPTALLLENKPFYYPDFTKNLHYEVEIVLRISKNGKGQPWELAKAFDSSAVLSSYVSLKDFDPSNITFSMTKNGEIVQVGTTKDLIFSFDTIVSFLSDYFTLQQGDLIYTGTPAGVGAIKVGDRLEGFLEGQSMFVCEIK
jgi:acylpyruvate hydrolase